MGLPVALIPGSSSSSSCFSSNCLKSCRFKCLKDVDLRTGRSRRLRRFDQRSRIRSEGQGAANARLIPLGQPGCQWAKVQKGPLQSSLASAVWACGGGHRAQRPASESGRCAGQVATAETGGYASEPEPGLGPGVSYYHGTTVSRKRDAAGPRLRVGSALAHVLAGPAE